MQLSFFENDYRQTKKYLDGVFKSKQEIVELLHKEGKNDIYFVLSFDGGTQSTHLLEEHFTIRITTA